MQRSFEILYREKTKLNSKRDGCIDGKAKSLNLILVSNIFRINKVKFF